MQTATNPQTGERVVLINGQWLPFTQSATDDKGQKAFLSGGQWIVAPSMAQAPEKPTTGAFAAGVKSYLPQVQETFGGLKTLLGVGAERVLGEGQISRGLIESGAASMKEAEAKRQPFMTA